MLMFLLIALAIITGTTAGVLAFWKKPLALCLFVLIVSAISTFILLSPHFGLYLGNYNIGEIAIYSVVVFAISIVVIIELLISAIIGLSGLTRWIIYRKSPDIAKLSKRQTLAGAISFVLIAIFLVISNVIISASSLSHPGLILR